MMTTARELLDESPQNAPGDLSSLEAELKDAIATRKAQTTVEHSAPGSETSQETTEKPDWIQAKFWNGNLAESAEKQAKAYPELQSAYGRMANDLGTQRKMTDRILALDKRAADLGTQQPKVEAPKVDPSALVNNPSEVLDKYWTERSAAERAAAQAEADRIRAAEAEAIFLSKHADFQDVTADPKFKQWVGQSILRQRAAVQAGKGDYSAADELLTEYKASQAQVQTVTDNQNLAAARKVSTESAANAGGSENKPKGKIYRRADLMALKMNKPDVYADPAFQEEIILAYREGRVK